MAAIDPFVALGVVVCVMVAVIVIEGQGVAVTENVWEPAHPLASFAVTE